LCQQQQADVKALDDKIQKHQKSIDKKLERINIIKGQLNEDLSVPEIPLDSLQAQHDELADIVNKLQSQADKLRQGDGPKVCIIETLSTH
jgi:hemerythrin-like domain-containing protein